MHIFFCLFLILSFWCVPPALAAEETSFEFGLRGGVNDSRNKEDYTASEVYLHKWLPWESTLSETVSLKTRLDAGLGYLEAAGDQGGYLAVGGDVVLAILNNRIEFEIGLRPTWLPDHEFGDDNFGGAFQFTSHIGLTTIWKNITFNYRLQHTSNAGVCDHNPGVNLHMVGLGYRF